MNLNYCLTQLTVNAPAVQQLVEGMDVEQACWKPAPDEWSVLEVINHLVDEEREDFRGRLEHILSGSTEPFVGYDPEVAVTERAYNQRDLAASLANYLYERQQSLEWLRGLTDVSWNATAQQPGWEGFRAGDMLVSWAAHDILHLRQLVELKWAYGLVKLAPYNPDYAGEW